MRPILDGVDGPDIKSVNCSHLNDPQFRHWSPFFTTGFLKYTPLNLVQMVEHSPTSRPLSSTLVHSSPTSYIGTPL